MKKRTKIIIAVVSFFLLISISANYILKGIFSEVVSELNANKDFPIHIDYRKTKFDIYSSHFKILDADITVKNPKTKPQLTIHVSAIKLSGLGLIKVLSKKYSIKDLVIENPTVCLYHLDEYDEKEEVEPKKKGSFPRFSWNEIRLIRGTFRNYKVTGADTTLTTELEGINLGFNENDITSVQDLLNKGRFNLDALSLNIGEKSRLYLKNSEFDLKKKRVVLRNVVFANDERHPRFFSSLKHKSLWKDIRLDSLEILGFGFGDTVQHKQLSIDSIVVFSPSILLKSKNSLPKNPEAKKTDIATLFPKSLDIHHIHVKNGKLEYRNYLKGINKYNTITIDTVNVHLNREGYAYAEGHAYLKSHPLGRGKVELKNFKSALKYPHELSVKKIEIDFDNDNLRIENVFLNNILDAEKFVMKQPFKEDWTQLGVSSISLNGFNLQKYLDKDSLLIDHVKINRAVLDSRNAGDLKRRPNRVGLLMHHLFRSLPGYHDVRDIRIVKSRVKFRMYFERATKSGLLDIENISASVDRITNLNKNFVTHVNGKGSYLGKNNLSLYVRLKVYDKDFKYNVNATAKHINLPDINSLIRPMNIMFLSGYMHLLQVDYNSKNLSADAVGTVLFHYDSLEIEILKKNKKKKAKKDSSNKEKDVNENNWFLSSAVNMVAKTENMPGHEGYIVGRVEVSRKSYQGFFGQLVGFMAKGAQMSLLNKKDKAKAKEERKHKKEEKRKHREERKKSRESLKELVE